MSVLRAIFLILRGLVRGRAALAVENLALRQQLAVLRRSVKRPSKCASLEAQVDAAGSRAGPFQVEVRFVGGRRHLPVISIRRAA